MRMYNIELVEQFFPKKDGYILCPTGYYYYGESYARDLIFNKKCKFDNGCEFGENIIFNEECVFGDNTLFKNNTEFAKPCIFGKNCKFDSVYKFANRCVFGENCEFIGPNVFGKESVFSDGCSFATFTNNALASRFNYSCTFGNGCKFNRCEFKAFSSFANDSRFVSCQFTNITNLDDHKIIDSEYVAQKIQIGKVPYQFGDNCRFSDCAICDRYFIGENSNIK